MNRLKHQLIIANFEVGASNSEDGLMLLRRVEHLKGLSAAIAAIVHDPRCEQPAEGFSDCSPQRKTEDILPERYRRWVKTACELFWN